MDTYRKVGAAATREDFHFLHMPALRQSESFNLLLEPPAEPEWRVGYDATQLRDMAQG
jgi:hypothetical protein